MKVSVSLLSAKNRIESVKKLNRTNASYIHVDVMDGKFVQDKQFDKVNEVNSINLISKYPMDIHLMVNNPYEYVIQYKNMNVEFITIHIEANDDKKRVIDEIKNMGYKVGIAIKPDTDIRKLNSYLDEIDMILVMSVEPGKGGQEFIHSTVDKINSIKELIGDRNILVEVDGGINDETISLVQMVDIVVSGSYVVKSDNYYKAIESLFNIENNGTSNANDNSSDKRKKIDIFKLFIIIFICLDFIVSFKLAYDSMNIRRGVGFGKSSFLDEFLLNLLLFPFWIVYFINWLIDSLFGVGSGGKILDFISSVYSVFSNGSDKINNVIVKVSYIGGIIFSIIMICVVVLKYIKSNNSK